MNHQLDKPYDAVVIGGGFAGLTAVRELSGLGFHLAIIESKASLSARNRGSRRHIS
ncbi:MAG: NAD(P)-binding protein [Chloroflexota bacterium]